MTPDDAPIARDEPQSDDRSHEQARDILAQWRAHTLGIDQNPQAALESAERLAEVFKVLSDTTRVGIIQTLIRREELCVRELAEDVGMSQSSISHHLRILRHFRLVRTRRSGREVFYSPGDPHVEKLIQVAQEHLQEKGTDRR